MLLENKCATDCDMKKRAQILSDNRNVINIIKSLKRILSVMLYRLPPFCFLVYFYRAIWGAAPLNEFGNYDEYWAKRQQTDQVDRSLPRYELVTRHIPDGASVLDIGCGDGSFLSYLKQQRPNADVLGIDISSKAVTMLRQRGLNGQVIKPSLPLRNQINRSFDYVVLMEVLEHVQDAETLCRQTLDFCPKRVFVTIPNMGFILNRLRLFIGGRMPVTMIVFHMREHIRFWTVKDFTQWTQTLGFKVDRFSYRYKRKSLWFFNKTIVRWYPSLFARQLVYELVPDST